MRQLRPSAGYYRIGPATHPFYTTGRLSQVIKERDAVAPEAPIYYLKEHDDGVIDWAEVSVLHHQHYDGNQVRDILTWIYKTDCTLSKIGLARFARISGLSYEQVRNATRSPESSNYVPLSPKAVTYVKWHLAEFFRAKQPKKGSS